MEPGPTTEGHGLAAALHRLRLGEDADAWAAVVGVLGHNVERLARRITGDAQEAADTAQETWLRVARGARRFAPRTQDPDADARRWVLRIAATTALQGMRQRRMRHRHAPRLAEAALRDANDPIELVMLREHAVLVRLALARLPEPLRTAVALRHLVGLGMGEIAVELGCPEGTAKAWVHRGLERMRRDLERHGIGASVLSLVQVLPSLPDARLAPLPAVTVGAGVKVAVVALVALGGGLAVAVPSTRRPPPPIPVAAAAAMPVAATAPVASTPAVTAGVPTTAPDALARWAAAMERYGKPHAAALAAAQGADRASALRLVAGDAAGAFAAIAERTRDPDFLAATDAAVRLYRDQVVLADAAPISAFESYPCGLLAHWNRTHEERTRAALVALSTRGAFAQSPAAVMGQPRLVFDAASLLLADCCAAAVGAPRAAHARMLVDCLLAELPRFTTAEPQPVLYVTDLAAVAHALILADDQQPDPRIAPALTEALDGFWQRRWLPLAKAFLFANRSDLSEASIPAPDLCLLVAPAYAWAFHVTGRPLWRDRALALIAGGVDQAFLRGDKQFNQSYSWSADAVAWLGEAAGTHPEGR